MHLQMHICHHGDSLGDRQYFGSFTHESRWKDLEANWISPLWVYLTDCTLCGQWILERKEARGKTWHG